MSSPSSKIVIVGGGITGPVLALLLKQKGWNPVVVEKVSDLGASGLAIALHPNGYVQRLKNHAQVILLTSVSTA